MSKLINWMDRNLYPNYDKNWDDTMFRSEIMAQLKKGHCILDMGAGAGIIPQMNFSGLGYHVCGIDPDERVLENPYLDEAKIAVGESIPYPDSSFDLVFADNVLEHLTHPDQVFNEVARLLRVGGWAIFG